MQKLESEVQSFVTPAVQSHGWWWGGWSAWLVLVGGWGAWLVGHGVQAVLVTAWHFTSLMLLKVWYSSLFHSFSLLEHDISKWTLFTTAACLDSGY